MSWKLEITNGVAWRKSGIRFEVCEATIRNADDNSDPLRTIYINDLNPEVSITVCFSRSECLKLAVWLFRKSIWPNPPRKKPPT